MALTATATPKVLKDISTTLGLIHPKIFSKSFERENIQYLVSYAEDKMGSLKKLLTNSRVNQSSSIVDRVPKLKIPPNKSKDGD